MQLSLLAARTIGVGAALTACFVAIGDMSTASSQDAPQRLGRGAETRIHEDTFYYVVHNVSSPTADEVAHAMAIIQRVARATGTDRVTADLRKYELDVPAHIPESIASGRFTVIAPHVEGIRAGDHVVLEGAITAAVSATLGGHQYRHRAETQQLDIAERIRLV
jgi:hypothetical protein